MKVIYLTILTVLTVFLLSCSKEKKHHRWIVGFWQQEHTNNQNYIELKFKKNGDMCRQIFQPPPLPNHKQECNFDYFLNDSLLILLQTFDYYHYKDSFGIRFISKDKIALRLLANPDTTYYYYNRIDY